MPSKMYNRARMTVTSTGTGALSLGVAVAGYQTFSSAGAQNSDTVSYTIEDGVNWEIGTGTFNSVAGTLSRTVTQSFNGTTYGTSAISVTTNAQVYITALAADIVVSGGALGTPSSATLTNATGLPLATGVTGTLPVANGGTGLTSLTAGRIPYGAGVSGTDPFGNSANLFWDAANSRLGIGTASPATILQISGANTPRLSIIDTTNNVEMQVLSDNTAGYVGTQTNHPTIFVANVSERMRITSTGTVNIVGAGTAGSTQAVSFNGSAPINSMVLDASGRLGIGITSPTATLHVKGGNTNNLKIDNDGSQYTEVDILNNGTIKAYCYWDNTNTNWHFRSLGSLQLITSGGSGATIDTSGNFGVGTSSPGYKLHVSGGAIPARYQSNSTQCAVNYQTSGSSTVYIGATATDSVYFETGGYTRYLVPSDGSHIWYGNGTERARIDTSGNVGIGTATPSSYGKFAVRGYVAGGGWNYSTSFSDAVYSTLSIGHASGLTLLNTDAAMVFAAASVERMRIDASGNLLVGTTSAVLAGKITVQYSGASARGISLDNTYNGTVNAVSCSYNGTYVGGLTSSATATALVTSSDVSLKENIAYATSALSSMLSLPIRQFDWKVDGSHTDYGVVAQEAYEHAPEMVTQGELWSVDYGRITPRLIKAFQELAAKVSALEAKQ